MSCLLLVVTPAREKKYTSVKLGKKARLFYKDQYKDKSPYLSDYIVEFKLPGENIGGEAKQKEK
ncbi:MAG: hypothetical protein ACTHJN_08870 [Ginsengibacter sp.]